ncbi:MAG TPA: hypothetical protein VFT95_20475 [Micromonosporaceae bacterium]|nr:hypothetical protein [Micromonosporaceae bacterium]
MANLTGIALFLGLAFAAQLEALRVGAPEPAVPDQWRPAPEEPEQPAAERIGRPDGRRAERPDAEPAQGPVTGQA